MPLLETNSKRIILASKSPRRFDLLKKIIQNFEVHVSDIDETVDLDDPVQFVLKISREKAEKIAARFDEGIFIGADSIVVLEGTILGKPEDKNDAARMLKLLSGKCHQVFTGFTILDKPADTIISDYEMTHVKFRDLKDWEIHKYIEVAMPFDKAGSYGIQDESAVFVEYIQGCFYNVMGLPVTKIYQTLSSILNTG